MTRALLIMLLLVGCAHPEMTDREGKAIAEFLKGTNSGAGG